MPQRFHWIIEGSLAGMEKPGTETPVVEDFLFLLRQGVDTIVTLTEDPYPPVTHLARKFEWLHFPINDFDVPDLHEAYELILKVDERIKKGKKVMMHCWAGLGRTGTMLACYMVYAKKEPASGIVAWLRSLDRGYVQTDGQENFVAEFEHYVAALRAEGK